LNFELTGGQGVGPPVIVFDPANLYPYFQLGSGMTASVTNRSSLISAHWYAVYYSV